MKSIILIPPLSREREIKRGVIMLSISYQYFFKSHFDDLPLTEEALFGKMLLPEKYHYLIEEAKAGDDEAIATLKEMFMYGKEGTIPNFEIAKRYWNALHSFAQLSCCPSIIADSLNEYAKIQQIFNRPLVDQIEAYSQAIDYMTSQLEPENWDISILQKHLSYLQDIFLSLE